MLRPPPALLLALLVLVGGCEQTILAYPEELVGVGIVVKTRDGEHYVQQVLEGGPASQGGLEAGARLLSVDGQSTEGEKLATLVSRLRGVEGSTVVLRVEGEAGVEVLTLVRRRLTRSSNEKYEAQKP